MKFLLMLSGVLLTILCWGAYGSVLHKGQHYLDGDRLKPLICVGAAYFFIAILIPVLILSSTGKLSGGWTFSGISWSMAAGAAGAFGALGIILALTNGGSPTYIMPLVFGGAPIVNVFVSMYFAKISWKEVNPVFIAGMIMVIVGAVVVLTFKPSPSKRAQDAAKAVEPNGTVDSTYVSTSGSENQDGNEIGGQGTVEST